MISNPRYPQSALKVVEKAKKWNRVVCLLHAISQAVRLGFSMILPSYPQTEGKRNYKILLNYRLKDGGSWPRWR